MNSRNLIILLATIVVIVAAWKVSQESAPSTEVVSVTLYPDLIGKLNDVQRISVATAEKATELAKKSDMWVVGNRDDFPAKFAEVKSLLLHLAEATVVENKTSKPENYAKLGVEGIETDSGGSRLVRVEDHNGAELVALLIGNARSANDLDTSYYFVRKSGHASALLAEGDFDVKAEPREWMETAVVNVAADRVRKVTINRNRETPIVISKSKRGENFFTLEAVPAGFTAKSRAVVSSLGALLIDVKFQDVAAAERVAGVVPRTIAEVQTFDGLVATVEQIDFEENVYVRFGFRFNPDIVEPDEEKAAVGEAPAETEPAPDEQTSVAEEVAALNATVADWVYVLPDYKVRMLDKKFDDMIKPAEPEPKAAEANKPE